MGVNKQAINVETIGRNFHIDERLKEHIEQKLDKVAKFAEGPVEVRVILEIEKYRHIAELHVAHAGGVIVAKEESEGNMLEAVNLAMDKAEKQARRSHKKRSDQRRRAGRNGHRWPLEVLERGSLSTGTPRIVESTHLEIKPMTIEEAVLELEASPHGFVVFHDASSKRLSVLYKRKDDNYGLIAPSER